MGIGVKAWSTQMLVRNTTDRMQHSTKRATAIVSTGSAIVSKCKRAGAAGADLVIVRAYLQPMELLQVYIS